MIIVIYDRGRNIYHVKNYEWGYNQDMTLCGVTVRKIFNNSFTMDNFTRNFCPNCLEYCERYFNYSDDIRLAHSGMDLNLAFVFDFKENKYVRDYRRYWPKLNKAKGKQAGNKFYDKIPKQKNHSKYYKKH